MCSLRVLNLTLRIRRALFAFSLPSPHLTLLCRPILNKFTTLQATDTPNSDRQLWLVPSHKKGSFNFEFSCPHNIADSHER